MLDTNQNPAAARKAPKGPRHPKFQRFMARLLLSSTAMPPLRKLLPVLLLLLALPAFAKGPGEGGGGDPMVQQFINMGKRLGYFFKANPFHAELTFKAEEFQARVKAIDESVKDESVADLLEFTDQILRDKDGREKAARFLIASGVVQVNRKTWKAYSEEERLILVTMEISGLLKADVRYETATALVQGHGALVLSIPLEKDGSFEMPGMRMAGFDPGQFGRIADQDVLIDGGVLGSGDASNKRVADFLDNPTADKEWFALLEKAKAMKRPAYMLLTGQNANRAAILSFYETKYEDGSMGVASYWLQVYKTRQVYTGPCAGEARELPANQRIKSCFLNLENFQFHDTIDTAKIGDEQITSVGEAWGKMGKALKEHLLDFLALDISILEEVARTNFLTDFSAIVGDPRRSDSLAQTFRIIVLKNTLAAHGWEPSLIGPFPGTPFWVKGKRKRPPAVRIFSALRALSENGLGFIDSATHCKFSEGTVYGPVLVSLQKIRAGRKTKDCTGHPVHWYPRLEPELLETLVKHGFFYDYAAETWRLDAGKGEAK